MKTTPREWVKRPSKAEIEANDIETRISIVRLSINKYKALLASYDTTEERLIGIKTKLENEEKYLRELKNKYPEYFI